MKTSEGQKNRRPFVFYHRTSVDAAKAILRDGFKDSTGHYGTDITLTGVWLSMVPLDGNEAAEGDALLRVTLPLSEEELDFYEVKEEGKTYREWIFPAKLLNARSTISRVPRSEEEQVCRSWQRC